MLQTFMVNVMNYEVMPGTPEFAFAVIATNVFFLAMIVANGYIVAKNI